MPRSVLGNEQVGHDLTDHEDIEGGPGQTPTDGDTFVYSTTLGKFDLQPAAGGHSRGHSLTDPLDHTDVNAPTPLDLQALVYNDATSKWVPGNTVSTGEQQEWPTRLFLGHLMSYPNQGSIGNASDIQYVRLWMTKGLTIVSLEAFVEQVPGGGSNMKLGLYNQTTPTSITEDPNAKVAETANIAITTGDNGTFKGANLTSPYVIPATGYYWLALIVDATQVKFAVSDTFRSGYLPRREQSGSGTTLPTTPSGLSNPQAACIYTAALRQV